MSFDTIKRIIKEKVDAFVDIRTMDMDSEQGTKLHTTHLKKAKADLKKNKILFGGSESAWAIKVNKKDVEQAVNVLKRNKLQTKVDK